MMRNKRGWKRLLAVTLTFLTAFTVYFAWTVPAEASTAKGDGFVDDEPHYFTVDDQVAFCLNKNKAYPGDPGTTYSSAVTTESQIEDNFGLTGPENERPADYAATPDGIRKLKSVLFYGYPNDGDGLIDKISENYPDTDAEYALRWATQVCVWRIAEGTNGDVSDSMPDTAKGISGEITAAIVKMIEDKYDAADTNLDAVTLQLFTSEQDEDTKKFQAMIKASIAEEETFDVLISKTDIDGTQQLTGAHLTITRSGEEEALEEWDTNGEVYAVQLAAGEYTLTETFAPDGYKIAEPITFTVEEDGTVTCDALTDGVIVMKDEAREPAILTTVKAKDKTASATAEARLTYGDVSGKVAVEDTIAYTDLIKDVTYTVNGTLVRVDEDGKILNDKVATASAELVAEGESGTWKLSFGEVQLESFAKYVVFESVYAIDNVDVLATKDAPLEHKETGDKAQTILTEDADGDVPGEKDTSSEEESSESGKEESSKESKEESDKSSKEESGKESKEDSSSSKATKKASTSAKKAKDSTTATSGKAAKTGDNSNIILWIILIAAAAVAVIGMIVYSRKKKKDDK